MSNVYKGKPLLVPILSVFFAGVVVCLTAGSALSQDCVPVQYTDEHEPERRALVIGNAIYDHHAPVTSATTDALEMTRRLTELNFKVGRPLVANTKAEFSKALNDFRATIGEGDLVVFYYSGHGFSYGTDSFLAPTNLPKSITENELPDAAMAIDSVKYRLESRKPGMVIMILDACRAIGEFVIRPTKQTAAAGSNGASAAEAPSGSNGDASETDVNLAKAGLQEPRTGDGTVNTIVAFATGSGKVAIGNNTANQMSLYTHWLVTHLTDEGERLTALLNDVGSDVSTTTNGTQNPTYSALPSYTDPFLRPTLRNRNEDKEVWCSYLDTGKPDRIQRYTSRHSVTRHTAAARRWLQEQNKSTVRGYTLVSAFAVDRAWGAFHDTPVAVRRLETGAFALPRSVEVGSVKSLATTTNTELGVVPTGTTVKELSAQKTGQEYLINQWGIDSTTPVERKLAFTIASMDLHETVVATRPVAGRAEPNDQSALVSRISAGTALKIQRLMEGANESVWMQVQTEAETPSFFVKIDPALTTSRSVVELGQSVKEIVVKARPNSIPDLVDPQPLREAVNELKNQGWDIKWVSLATGAVNDETKQAEREARLANAQYLLKEMGIPGVRITSLTEVPDFNDDGVRVRFFGIRK